jgi:sugar (pentulose or hexulose) kinase
MYLGIDFGTSGCRAVVIDSRKNTLAEAAQPLPAAQSLDGKTTQNPQLWLDALDRLLQDLSTKTPLCEIRRIAVDGTSGTVLLCDSKGNPLTDALMYNDASSVLAVNTIRQHCLVEQHLTMTTSSGLAKAIYLTGMVTQKHFHILNQSDFISNTLANRWGFSDYHNALKLGFDAEQLCWPDWVSALLPQGCLPQVLEPGSVFATISPHFQQRFGFADDCEICVGSTDANAAFIATGANRPGDAVTSLGTTMVLKVLGEHPVNDLASGVYSHRLGDLWLVGGASNAGAGILRKFFSDREIASLSEKMTIEQPTGLDYYPLTSKGERFPVNDPGLLPRLSPRPTSDVRFLQGLLEGLSHIEKTGYDKLQQLGSERPKQILSCGGGAKNPQWLSMRQQILGIPLSVAAHSEACFGSALLALGANSLASQRGR